MVYFPLVSFGARGPDDYSKLPVIVCLEQIRISQQLGKSWLCVCVCVCVCESLAFV